MITKGVASVRSPVCNLQQFNATISHDTFSNAVIRAFRQEYCLDQEVSCACLPSMALCMPIQLKPYTVEEDAEITDIEYIRKGMVELPVRIIQSRGNDIQPVTRMLQSWNWAYGQTPEFIYNIKKTFEWGDIARLSHLAMRILAEPRYRAPRLDRNMVSFCHVPCRTTELTKLRSMKNYLNWPGLSRGSVMGLWIKRQLRNRLPRYTAEMFGNG